jgi:hypothetical protein
MRRVAVMVDSHGVLNVTTLTTSGAANWQGPRGIGNANLVPGSPIAVCRQSRTVFTALMIDRDGILNIASLDTSSGADWQGPDGIGGANLVPGSPIAVCRQSRTVFTALMIDRDGILNIASLDVASGDSWQGPLAVGSATLVAGSPITVIPRSRTLFTALMVDRDGTLNVAMLDTSSGAGWQGPDSIGNANLVPGSLITSLT